MKRKICLSVLFALVLVSCSENEAVNPHQTEVYDFKNKKELSAAQNQVATLKRNLEKLLNDKFLGYVNAPKPINKVSAEKMYDEQLAANIKFYHEERLKAIYTLRRELKFTSIQSIADEINSLTAVQPRRAQELYDQHAKFLVKDKFMVSTVFDMDISDLTNTNGELRLDNMNIAESHENGNAAREFSYIGKVVSSSDNKQIISYGYRVGSTVISGQTYQDRTTYFTTYMYCNVWYAGQYVLYPCNFFISTGSACTFTIVAGTGNVACPHTSAFPSGYGSSLSYGTSYQRPANYGCDYTGVYGSVGGAFGIPIAPGVSINLYSNGVGL